MISTRPVHQKKVAIIFNVDFGNTFLEEVVTRHPPRQYRLLSIVCQGPKLQARFIQRTIISSSGPNPYLACWLRAPVEQERKIERLTESQNKLLVKTFECRVGSHPLKIAIPIPRVFEIFDLLDDRIWDWNVLPLGLKHVLIIVRKKVIVDSLTELQWKCEQA